MGAGTLVVTYPLTGRSRTIVEEELGGTAEAIYLVDLPPTARAHALRSLNGCRAAGSDLSTDRAQPDDRRGRTGRDRRGYLSRRSAAHRASACAPISEWVQGRW